MEISPVILQGKMGLYRIEDKYITHRIPHKNQKFREIYPPSATSSKS
jgi:hypothetical protein